MTKNKAAQELNRLRWERGELTEAAREAARRNGKLGGRPKSRRCPCGKMTVGQAVTQGHQCVYNEFPTVTNKKFARI